jgi:hypothetical protein
VVPQTTPSRRTVARRQSERRSRASSEETRQFEELVLELASAFVRVTTDRIDQEINRWLERIVLALGVDRSTLSEINPSNGWATFSHGWAREPERIIGNSLDANALLPWTKQNGRDRLSTHASRKAAVSFDGLHHRPRRHFSPA